jgi:hypothetical protein
MQKRGNKGKVCKIGEKVCKIGEKVCKIGEKVCKKRREFNNI